MFYKNILDPFLESTIKNKTNNAFCINERFYSYNQLAEKIYSIRSAIQKENVIGKNIGLIAHDDIETYASIFAIWLEGAAYVPLHPQQPFERNKEIINESGVFLLLNSDPGLKSSFTNTIETKNLIPGQVNNQSKKVFDESPAYILFTSGSTGKPKGVEISRKNVSSFMKSFMDTGIQLNENDRCLQCFDLTFDVSVQSFLVPLIKGACVYTIPHDRIKYSYMYGLLENHKITFGAMAPSMIRYLRPYFNEVNVPEMRYNILTAEASPLDLIKEWSNCIPNAEIYDFYGPTEATIYCTFNKFNRSGKNKCLNGMLSIGKVMNGIDAIIIDEEGKILGKNQKGELCISGDQISPGYCNDDEKNKHSFFEINYKGKITRFYKTGDSCYFDDEDDIMLAGRLDHQVKIQGYRIELGEVEYHAREFLSGQNAVASAFKNQLGNTEIALFVEGRLSSKTGLMEFLNKKMPYYMIPTKIISEGNFH